MYTLSSNQKALIMKGTTDKALKLFQKNNLVILKQMRKYLFFFSKKYFIWKNIFHNMTGLLQAEDKTYCQKYWLQLKKACRGTLTDGSSLGLALSFVIWNFSTRLYEKFLFLSIMAFH